jgi:hypothetical protein
MQRRETTSRVSYWPDVQRTRGLEAVSGVIGRAARVINIAIDETLVQLETSRPKALPDS